MMLVFVLMLMFLWPAQSTHVHDSKLIAMLTKIVLGDPVSFNFLKSSIVTFGGVHVFSAQTGVTQFISVDHPNW